MKVISTLLAVLLFSFGAAFLLFENSSAATRPRISAVATLPSGAELKGKLVSAEGVPVSAFLGIPYARPPVGERRWAAPEPFDLPKGTHDLTGFGPSCVQQVLTSHPKGAITGQEDCLYMNIWAPAGARDQKLPVLFWIHGGGFVRGTASNKRFDGRLLAAQGVVVVTFNYRLGVLAQPPGPLIGDNSEKSANYGIQDQIEALAWVHRNISSFGGDPDRIVAAGSSAGGASTGLLITNPGVVEHHLISKAIVMSGGGFGQRLSIHDVHTTDSDFFVRWQTALDQLRQRAKCQGAGSGGLARGSGFREAEAAKGMAWALRMCTNAAGLVDILGGRWSPDGIQTKQELQNMIFEDGNTVTDPSLIQSFAQKHEAQIPLLFGFARNEMTEAENRGEQISASRLIERFQHMGASDVLRTLADASKLYPDAANEQVVTSRLYSGFVYGYPAQILSCLHGGRGLYAAVYRFDYVSTDHRNQDTEAGHSDDALWLFGGPKLLYDLGIRKRPPSNQDVAFQRYFARSILSFIGAAAPEPSSKSSYELRQYVPGLELNIFPKNSSGDDGAGVQTAPITGGEMALLGAMAKHFNISVGPAGCEAIDTQQ